MWAILLNIKWSRERSNTIKVSAPEEISFKIRGIYRTPEVYQSDSVVNDWHNNLIFIPLDIFCEYSMKALKNSKCGI